MVAYVYSTTSLALGEHFPSHYTIITPCVPTKHVVIKETSFIKYMYNYYKMYKVNLSLHCYWCPAGL